jgi:histidinol-phosphatase (PHP family)
VKSALSQHFRAYGFSSHAPIPFATPWHMSSANMPEYLSEIARLKAAYAGQIELYVGLEIDYLDASCNASIPYFQALPLDYRIGSIHYISRQTLLTESNAIGIDGPYEDFAHAIEQDCGGNIRMLTEWYFRASMCMVEAGGFDVVGHMDKIYMNASRHPDFDLAAPWYRNLVEAYIDLIAEKELIVEINTKNLRLKKQLFPHLSLWKLLQQRHVPVMVNSDCHSPELVNDGRNEAFAFLKDAGFHTTRELVDGQWQEVPIE